VKNITGIQFNYLPSKDIKDKEVKLADWYASTTRVPYTRAHHCFIPTGTSKIIIQCVSSSTKYKVVSRKKDVPFKLNAAETKKKVKTLPVPMTQNDGLV
jgi:hypothetical protein